MDNSHIKQSKAHLKEAADDLGHSKEHLKAAADELLSEGKKYAHEMYEDGLNKVHHAQESVKECSEDLLQKVKENPLASVLIAGGIGFLLSCLLRK